MDRPQFQGYPAFLEFAAAEIGHPEVAGPAARITALAALANLCAQAIQTDGAHVPEILAKAEEFREQLRAAFLAADLMLDFIRTARGVLPKHDVEGTDRTEERRNESRPVAARRRVQQVVTEPIRGPKTS